MTLPDGTVFLLLALLGGVLALDGTGVGQLMLSRPLVAATLGGWAVGRPLEGVIVGAVLEALELGILPVGAARNPESGPAGVVAGAGYALDGGSGAALVGTLLFAMGWEWVGGATVKRMRIYNTRFAQPEDAPHAEPRALERGHLAAVGGDFVRGVLLVAVGLPLLLLLLSALPPGMLPRGWGRLAAAAVAAAALGSTLRTFGARRYPWFLGGAALALLLAGLR